MKPVTRLSRAPSCLWIQSGSSLADSRSKAGPPEKVLRYVLKRKQTGCRDGRIQTWGRVNKNRDSFVLPKLREKRQCHDPRRTVSVRRAQSQLAARLKMLTTDVSEGDVGV